MTGKNYIAYFITNNTTGEKYIGITTKSVEWRLRQHKKDAKRGANMFISRAIRKYGESVFSIEHILSCKNVFDLKECEKQLIEQYGTFAPGGYNLTKGGDGLSGYTPTDETKAKIINARKGYTHSKETREKLREANKGKRPPESCYIARLAAMETYVVSEETKAKISISHKGKRKSEKTRAAMSAATKGRPKSEAHRKSIGDASRGRPVSSETREKLRAVHLGTKKSDECKAKVSAAHKGRIHTDESRANMSAAHIGKPWSEKRRHAFEQKKIRLAMIELAAAGCHA